jgi:hypothetical protein
MPIALSVPSLANIRAGERVRIERVYFADAVHSSCPDLRFECGEVVRCLADSPLHIVLGDDESGRRVLDRFYASFVEVTPMTNIVVRLCETSSSPM